MTPDQQAYYIKHRAALEQMKRDAIASVPCQRSVSKMIYDCECGATVICKNLQFHFLSVKHRSVCGDLYQSYFLLICWDGSVSHHQCNNPTSQTTTTGMAQRERVGLITPRSLDQNQLPVWSHVIFACTQVHPKTFRQKNPWPDGGVILCVRHLYQTT